MSNSANFNLIAHIVMLGWLPICIALFLFMRPVKAVATGLVAGLLLLPNISYEFRGLPEYDKIIAVGFGVALAALVFDRRRLLSFRPHWVDLPVIVLCLSAFCSAFSNDRGLWFACSATFGHFVRWGVPWILGRIYFADFKPQQQLALAIIIGALIYTPFCLFEVKMSPLLHDVVYGVKLKAVKHAQRGILWRPNVFLIHGLMAAMYLAMGAFLAFTLWFSKARRELFGAPMLAVAGLLVAMTVAASSKNALLMLMTGIGCMVIARTFRWGFPVLLLVLLPPAYVGLRQGYGWEGQELAQAVEKVFGRGRARSLQVRLDSENFMHDRTNQKLWFGWSDVGAFTGNQERQRLHGDKALVVIVDSMWLIYVGLGGVVALVSVFALMLLPPFLAWKHLPARYWTHPALSVTVALSMLSLLFALDCLLNSFDNPVFIAAGGGVSGLLGTREGKRKWKG